MVGTRRRIVSDSVGKKKTSKTKRLQKLKDPRLDAPTVFTDELKIGKYGDIFALSDTSGQTPVGGSSYYIFLDQSRSDVTLFHPFSAVKFSMDISRFCAARGNCDWNPTSARLAEILNKKIKLERELKREVPSFILLLVKHYEELANASII